MMVGGRLGHDNVREREGRDGGEGGCEIVTLDLAFPVPLLVSTDRYIFYQRDQRRRASLNSSSPMRYGIQFGDSAYAGRQRPYPHEMDFMSNSALSPPIFLVSSATLL